MQCYSLFRQTFLMRQIHPALKHFCQQTGSISFYITMMTSFFKKNIKGSYWWMYFTQKHSIECYTNMYFIISYSVPQQRTLHWADHQNTGSRSLQKPYFRLVSLLNVWWISETGWFIHDTDFEFLIISLGIYVEMSFLVHPRAQKAWKFLYTS